MNGIGAPHRHFRLTDSTNLRAREMAAAGAPHGTVVTAAEQTAGRGRQGRAWIAPAGRALLYSAILRGPLGERPLLPLAAALAVCDAAEELQPGVRCRVKWPNDVQVGGRKLAGVLIEARPREDWAVVGVGLNLSIEAHEFPPDLRESATSLAAAFSSPSAATLSHPIGSTTRFTSGVLSDRLARWAEAGEDEVLAAWSERDALLGSEVGWEGGSGVADGIDRGGGLVVVVPAGERVVLDAGEVHLVGV